MKLNKKLAPLLLALTIVSCGKDSKSSNETKILGSQNNVPQEEQIIFPSDGSNIQGKYLARFQTLNGHVNGTVPGSVTFFRDKDRVMVYLRLFAGYPKAWHPQKIYEGTRCPTLADDTNGDGYIDINEAEAVLGKILIPLDADISSQRSGRNFYPLGDLSGNYFYERMTSFSRMFRDLKDTRSAGDEYKKLGPDEGFSIEGKAVLVQGVGKDVEFPETVGSAPRYKPFQTLPVACGIFVSDNRVPGMNDDGEIAGPIADVDPDQDRPARDGDGETDREDPGPRGDRTNDADAGNTPTVDSDGRSSSDSNPRPPTNYGEDRNTDDDDRDDRRTGSGNSTPVPTPTPTPPSTPTPTPEVETPPVESDSEDLE